MSSRALKWRTLGVLAVAELLAMSVWFSASAVVPSLTRDWQLGDAGRSWLTMSVQLGFVLGALVSAATGLADRLSARALFAGSAVLCGVFTLAVPWLATGVGLAIALRLATGVCLAGVYPIGMKIMASWTREDRGVGIGLLVGALTLGSAMPHLLAALGGVDRWQPVLVLAGCLALVGGVLAFALVDEGPYRSRAARFDWHRVRAVLLDRDVVLANLGYLGHMWELYAMWTWLPVFLLASFTHQGLPSTHASGLSFTVIAIGGIGSVLAGHLADRIGRTTVTSLAMVMSGTCAVLVGALFDGPAWLLALVCLAWGLSVVADSAQFSAAVSELAPPQSVGTALTLQTSVGFLLTLFTIRMVPPIEHRWGWAVAFCVLAIGPAIGVVAMMLLRRSPGARKLGPGR